MGVYIDLSILPHRISPRQWHQAYEELLAFLQGYPGGMMGLQRERINESTRTVYSRKLERDTDDPKERRWLVVGDFKSKETCEWFRFYHDLEQYRSKIHSSDARHRDDDDIIVSLAKEKNNYCKVFSEKTQGSPYHIPLLAAAMLVEDCLPKYAAAGGNIDLHQAKEAQALIKTVLKKEIALPIRVDAARLWKRIQAHEQGKKAMQHFDSVFLGEANDKFEALSRMGDQVTFMQWFLEELRTYESPTQLGAIGLLISWLNAKRDLRTLCELACLNKEGPRFDPMEFSSALASTWISVEKPLRDVMRPFRKPKGTVDTVMTQFGTIWLDLMGTTGRHLRFYMSEKQVLETLKDLFPAQILKMAGAFMDKTDKLRKHLSEAQEPMQKLVETTSKDDDPETGDGSSFLRLKSLGKINERQTILLQSLAYRLAKVRAQVMKEFPQIFQETASSLWEKIIKLAERNYVILAEDAWQWIDKEKDLELLQLVFICLLIDDSEVVFLNMRRAVLEKRDFCRTVLKMTHEEALLAKFADKIRN